jgi:hypothetical protein
MKWTRRTALMAGLALIVTVNLVALGGALYNRSGEPESVLSLTERELRPPYTGGRGSENSGLTLQLRWRVLQEGEIKSYYAYEGEGGGVPAWLDDAKMAALGFQPLPATSEPGAGTGRRHPLPRDVLLVLELNGPTHERALERARQAAKLVEAKNERGEGRKDAREILDREERLNSRLFAIDAGLDREALRAKYPDRQKYAIVRGRVRQDWWSRAQEGGGRIDDLSADQINVPLEMRAAFEGVSRAGRRPANDDDRLPFEARVAFGQRLEPWIVSAAR